MRVLGVTQGNQLRIFLELSRRLSSRGDASPCGVYAADLPAYRRISADFPEVGAQLPVLGEWEVVRPDLRPSPDWQRLAAAEDVLGDPTLWSALLVDRRLFFGRYSKRTQAYTPRFSHATLAGVALRLIDAIDDFMDRQRPDVVMAFGLATIGDWLFARSAEARGIPYLQLKSTKIRNFVQLSDRAIGLSRHIAEPFLNGDEFPAEAMQVAEGFLAEVRAQGLQYEGVIARPAKPPPVNIPRTSRRLAGSLRHEVRRWRDEQLRNDNHGDGYLVPAWYEEVVQPLRARAVQRYLRSTGRLLRLDELDDARRVVFYPLHFEPEVALQVQGRPYQNQIELIRNLALACPIDALVVVKEHPRSMGFRPRGYYRRLLDIPNVVMVEPTTPASLLVSRADLVTVVSGAIGFEAAIRRKPVLVFGRPDWDVLPDALTHRVVDLHDLPTTIAQRMGSPGADDDTLLRFVAANVAGGLPIDLYSRLLDKPGRIGASDVAPSAIAAEYDRLTEYTAQRLRDVLTNSPQP